MNEQQHLPFGGPILAALSERRLSTSSDVIANDLPLSPSPTRRRASSSSSTSNVKRSGLTQALKKHDEQNRRSSTGGRHHSTNNTNNLNNATTPSTHGKSLFVPVPLSALSNSRSVPMNLSEIGSETSESEFGSDIPIQAMSLSESKANLRALRTTGWLEKRGFHWFKRWKRRWVVLQGRLLHYYETRSDGQNTKHSRSMLELNAYYLIMKSDLDSKEYGFKIVPVATPTSFTATPNILLAELVDDVTEFDDGKKFKKKKEEENKDCCFFCFSIFLFVNFSFLLSFF